MEKVKGYFQNINTDQKKFFGTALFIFFLLMIYALSKNSDFSEHIVEEPKKEAFKDGDLVMNSTSDYYKNKSKYLSKQYEDVKSSQKLFAKELKELKVSLEQARQSKEQLIKDTMVADNSEASVKK